MRVSALLFTVVLIWPTWAPAQDVRFFCQFDDAQAMIECIKRGDPEPSFQYRLRNIDINFLAEIVASARAAGRTGMVGEHCRLRVESFRKHRIEDSFRDSLEELRLEAESLRKASLNLYNQVIIVYRGLLDEYSQGIQAYRKAIEACVRTTPFPVYPRFSAKTGKAS